MDNLIQVPMSLRNLYRIPASFMILSSKPTSDGQNVLMTCKTDQYENIVMRLNLKTLETEILATLPPSQLGYSDSLLLPCGALVVVEHLTGRVTIYRDGKILPGNTPIMSQTGLSNCGKLLQYVDHKLLIAQKVSPRSTCLAQITVKRDSYHLVTFNIPGIKVLNYFVAEGLLWVSGQQKRQAVVAVIHPINFKILKVLPVRTKGRINLIHRDMDLLVLCDSENWLTVYDKHLEEIARVRLSVGNNPEMQTIIQAKLIQNVALKKLSRNNFQIAAVSADGDKRLFSLGLNTLDRTIRINDHLKELHADMVSGMHYMSASDTFLSTGRDGYVNLFQL